VADSVSNGGLEGDAARVESRKVYANELAWLEDCVHRQMFALSQGKCKISVRKKNNRTRIGGSQRREDAPDLVQSYYCSLN
jgi:hypothetical protein